jgi:phosphoglycolate phosphatase-like HAD superfamily hydrolase
MNKKIFYALDFDGVICHSAVETAITGWTAAQSLWPDMRDERISEKEIQQFRAIRPCLEFGSEAVIIMRLLQQSVAMSPLCDGYNQQIKSVIEAEDLDLNELQTLFGDTRDSQIQNNQLEWINNNPLFEGISEKLKTLAQDDWVIVTTKQERFVKAILQANQISLDETRIFGLERKLNKQTLLAMLQKENPDRPITFIEDRLPTLLGVLDNPQLQSIKLQLVDWGYNTERDRELAYKKDIDVIGLGEFLS